MVRSELPDCAGKNSGLFFEVLTALANDIHRIGGGTVEKLRLKPDEAAMDQPELSVLKAPTPNESSSRIKAAFPKAAKLQEAAKTVGSTTEELIRDTGFDIIPNPTKRLPNHHRLIHPDGVSGFSDENLAKLAEVFINTTGN